MKPEEEAKLKEILDTFMTDPNIRQMENYIQHGSTTTLDHCMAVARVSFEINHALHLHVDDVALIRTALLHDYYLYDWHKKGHPPLHGYRHDLHGTGRQTRFGQGNVRDFRHVLRR